jgi:hypothetical protein
MSINSFSPWEKVAEGRMRGAFTLSPSPQPSPPGRGGISVIELEENSPSLFEVQ